MFRDSHDFKRVSLLERVVTATAIFSVANDQHVRAATETQQLMIVDICDYATYGISVYVNTMCISIRVASLLLLLRVTTVRLACSAINLYLIMA